MKEGWKWGDTVQGSTDYDKDEGMRELFSLAGTKAGDWKTEEIRTFNSFEGERIENPVQIRHYMDTPYGRITDDIFRNSYSGDNYSFSGGHTGAKYANQHGSDLFRLTVDKDGYYQAPRMDRQSNADRNWALAAIATMGIASAYIGAGAAASGAGTTAGGTAGAVGGTTAGGVAGTTTAGGVGGGSLGTGLTVGGTQGMTLGGLAPAAGMNGAGGLAAGGISTAGTVGAPGYLAAGSFASEGLVGLGAAGVAGGTAAGSTAGSTAAKTATNSIYDKALGYAKSELGQKVISNGISAIGSAINDYYTNKQKEASTKEEREWQVRNMNLQNMPRIAWTTRRVAQRVKETPDWLPSASAIGSTKSVGRITGKSSASEKDDYATKAGIGSAGIIANSGIGSKGIIANA